MIKSAARVAELGTILGVWAHPDDEAYLSGGLMALASDTGSRVVCVTATRGERGTPDPVQWPPERLAAARTVEMGVCMEILGVAEHHWLDYRDGECDAVPRSEAVERIATLIGQVRPDTVLTFGPDGITGHPDHQTIAQWTTEAFDRAAPAGARLLYSTFAQRRTARWDELNQRLGIFPPGYPVVTPDDRLAVDLELNPATAARKARALAAQQTQTEAVIAELGLERYTAWVSGESFVEAARRPDAAPAPADAAAAGGDTLPM